MPLADLRSRARKDPLGVTLYNQMLSNLRWQWNAFTNEHRVSDGLHNAGEIPMCVAGVVWDGADYSIEGGENGTADVQLDGTQADYNPTAGTVVLTCTGLTFGDPLVPTPPQIAVIVSSGSETGQTQPMVTAVELDVALGTVTVYLATSTLPANGWSPEDGNFYVALYSVPLVRGALPDLGTPSLRGQGLWASRWNKLVGGLASLYGKFNLYHDASTGEHDVRTVAKAEALVIWDGATYSVDANSGTNIASVTRIGAGIIEVAFTSALVAPLQVFPELYVIGSRGSTSSICAPRSLAVGATVQVFIYDYGDYGSHAGPPPYLPQWKAVDKSFTLSVHGT